MSKHQIINKIIEHHLTPGEDYIYGFADLKNLIDKQFGDYQYGISIGKRLDSVIVNGIMGGPTIEYYRHYRAINTELAALTRRIADDLMKEGIHALCVEPTVTTEELDTIYSESLTYAVSHKMVATRAGLGWIGKSDLFISKAFGPRLRLVSILTDTPLEVSHDPVEASRCGHCRICMDRCPAGAINGKAWDVSIHRDEYFDAFKCREMCKELGEKTLKMNVRVCGICVAVCPFGW